ncbi:hypothetical protein TIFTF001_046528 [Ficus carica]|uniref:Uncharacterized protein n=1 Tax=Ficus carica TaxID=3494 RepID=A0AA87ZGX2_FICCA|nr:hypothetical protein TIFTF001_046528 [Ficus carica]
MFKKVAVVYISGGAPKNHFLLGFFASSRPLFILEALLPEHYTILDPAMPLETSLPS